MVFPLYFRKTAQFMAILAWRRAPDLVLSRAFGWPMLATTGRRPGQLSASAADKRRDEQVTGEHPESFLDFRVARGLQEERARQHRGRTDKAAPSKPRRTDMDIQTKITSLAGMSATWVMWVLVGLSVGGLAIALERAIYLALRSDNLRKLKAEVLAFLRKGDVAAARSRLGKSKSFEAQVVSAGLDNPADGAAAAEERMDAAAQLAKLRMERRLAFLGTLGSNAPFLGLLGTVIGIVRAFHELNGAAGRVSAGLMSQVGEALIATAVGIMVALPAIAAYNYFQRIIKARITRADAFGKEVLALLKSEQPAVAFAPRIEPVLIERRVA
jgi:biopolymer transport protein ExbB/TolQ